jgi:hypothetical protein
MTNGAETLRLIASETEPSSLFIEMKWRVVLIRAMLTYGLLTLQGCPWPQYDFENI